MELVNFDISKPQHFEVIRTVIKLINEDKHINNKRIAEKIGKSKSYVSELMAYLESRGFVKVKTLRPKTYELTELGLSLLPIRGSVWAPLVRSDALRVWFRVVRVGVGVGDWLERVCSGRRVMRGGWVKYNVPFDDSCFVEFNFSDLNPSVEVVFRRFWVGGRGFLGGFMRVFLEGVSRVLVWLRLNGVEVDLNSMRITNQEFEHEVDERDRGSLPGQGVYRVELPRKARTVLGELKKMARVWLDFSLGEAERGTNDLEHLYRYLLMPEYLYEVHELVPELESTLKDFNRSIGVLSRNLEAHVAVMQRIDEGLAKLNSAVGELSRSVKKEGWIQRIKRWLFRV